MSTAISYTFNDAAAGLAAQMLADEVERLTGERPGKVSRGASVVFTLDSALPEEAYRLSCDGERATVAAADRLGFVFGVGGLLADAVPGPNGLQLPVVDRASAPQQPLRGMWMASHVQSNAYYTWRIDEWEPYVRSLMLWGMNQLGGYPVHMSNWRGAIPWGEKGPYFASAERQAEWEAFWTAEVELCQLAKRLGLQYHIWVPPNDIWPDQLTDDIYRGGDNACPSTAEGRRLILAAREELFKRLPHIDVLFVPSHDNGGCPCPDCEPWVDVYLPLVRDQAALCRKYHPQAKIWLSTQHLSRAENETLYAYLQSDEGAWVDGVVFGPWSIADAAELRKGLPDRVPLINYPDITHALRCQNPIKGLDYFTSKVFERDGPTSRPRDMERIWRWMAPHAAGSSPYSEGLHDDLNKAIWLQLGWDQEQPVRATVERYCRRWFGEAAAKEMADLLYQLEDNWSRPLAGNDQIPGTASRMRQLVKGLGRQADWRAWMFLIRALVELYAQQKLARDRRLEDEFYDLVRHAPADRLSEVVPPALWALDTGTRQTVDVALRDEIMRIAGRLEQVPGMRIDSAKRLDFAMNDLVWLQDKLGSVTADTPAEETAKLVDEVLEWQNPGPGGFYDDGGDPGNEPHLVLGDDYVMEYMGPLRHSQTQFAYNFADTPGVIFEYEGLDPQAGYVVRVDYVTTGRMKGNVMLVAGTNGEHEIHGPLDMPHHVPERHEYAIPPAAYADGKLRLNFKGGGKGRGPLVSELWVIRR